MGENMNKNNIVRLFVAVDFPSAVLSEVERIQDELRRKKLFEGRFTNPEQVHITIKFIGEVAEDQVAGVETALQRIQLPKMAAQLSGLDVFAVGNKIKIVYLNVVCPPLSQLATHAQEALLPWSEREKRDFVSHATIARVKRVEDKPRLLGAVRTFEVQPLQFTFDEFVLKQSVLSDQGPTYTNVAVYPLGKK